MVAALYTIGLAHLGSQLSGHELASANAAFVLCYGVGMVLGPQAIGIGMDVFGPSGFGWSLGLFFAAYIALVGVRLSARSCRAAAQAAHTCATTLLTEPCQQPPAIRVAPKHPS